MKQLIAIAMMLFSASILYAQDIITLRTGETINGKVTEVGVNEIRYYKEENPDGPVYVTSRDGVANIVYANGTKDVFKPQDSRPVEKYRAYNRRPGRYFYQPYVSPIFIPHIDLGHHGFFNEHHGGYHGGYHGGHH